MTFKFLRDDGQFAAFGSTAANPLTTIYTNTLGSSVTLTTGAAYTDGPSVAQGTTGTWFVSGSVNLAAGATCTPLIQLWDGATTLGNHVTFTASIDTQVALCGVITNPAGNLRISGRLSVAGNTGGFIATDGSAGGHNSTITAIRIG